MLLELSVNQEKARVVFDTIHEEYFELCLAKDKNSPGIKTWELKHMHSRMQLLSHILLDYLWEMGKLIDAMRDDANVTEIKLS